MAILTLECGLTLGYQKNYNNKSNKIQQCMVMKTSSELFTAKICTEPSKPTGLPNRRKHFEVRRCPVRVLNKSFTSISRDRSHCTDGTDGQNAWAEHESFKSSAGASGKSSPVV